MPAVTSYDTLKASVLAALEREEDAQAIELFDEWIQMTEDEFATLLRAPFLIRVGVFTYNPENPELGWEYLPPSFTEMISITPFGGGRALEPVDSVTMSRYLRSYGSPRVYCVEGTMLTIGPPQKAPIPPAEYPQYRMVYYSRSEPLTFEHQVNDIIKFKPLLYKYGCLRHGKVQYGEDVSMEGAIFNGMIQTCNEMVNPWRRGSGARVRVA